MARGTLCRAMKMLSSIFAQFISARCGAKEIVSAHGPKCLPFMSWLKIWFHLIVECFSRMRNAECNPRMQNAVVFPNASRDAKTKLTIHVQTFRSVHHNRNDALVHLRTTRTSSTGASNSRHVYSGRPLYAYRTQPVPDAFRQGRFHMSWIPHAESFPNISKECSFPNASRKVWSHQHDMSSCLPVSKTWYTIGLDFEFVRGIWLTAVVHKSNKLVFANAISVILKRKCKQNCRLDEICCHSAYSIKVRFSSFTLNSCAASGWRPLCANDVFWTLFGLLPFEIESGMSCTSAAASCSLWWSWCVIFLWNDCFVDPLANQYSDNKFSYIQTACRDSRGTHRQVETAAGRIGRQKQAQPLHMISKTKQNTWFLHVFCIINVCAYSYMFKR